MILVHKPISHNFIKFVFQIKPANIAICTVVVCALTFCVSVLVAR